jgi:hypothetical protein
MKSPWIGGLFVVSHMTMLGLLVSCTKEVPYEYQYKGDGAAKVLDKNIDPNTEYLFVASSDLANQDSTGAAQAMPYWQGEEKIVKMRFTEDSLQIVQVNEETRLGDNKTNEKVVMEIPVTHIDYRCALDRYQKCTNREEINNDIPWEQRTKFLPKFDALKTVGFSLLPVEMDKVFGGSCFTEESSKFLGYEMTDESLNIQVQKVFKGDISCLESSGTLVSSLEDLQTQIIYHYSFTKMDKMSSASYKAVNYPESDEGTFGFFTTNSRKYDVDFNRTDRMPTQLLNRWNPERKEVVYYLTDNFNKPEMAAIKKATEEAFEQVNKGLQTAGIETRLVLKDPAHKVPGDVRNSMVILVEDPVAAGPLGYGPTVANPRTGEILSGRVAMYYGNYLQNIKYSYDEVVRELQKEKNEIGNPPVEAAKAGPAVAANSKSQAVTKNIASSMAASYNSFKQAVGGGAIKGGFELPVLNPLTSMTQKAFMKSQLRTDKTSTAKSTLGAMSKYCNYPAELFPFDEIIRGTLQTKLGTDLRPWNQLTAAEQKVVLAVLLPEVWKPTLVHELGHNLGLRHNFGGSEDKPNFYSTTELAIMGVKHEIPYSSVMDYGNSELNLLPTLGKYDIAALRFAYKRVVETSDGKTLPVASTLAKLQSDMAASGDTSEFKAYQYCSDEHVDANPNCKRFDKGTNMTEIVNYLIQSYEDYYAIRNFRNGRESFSKYSEASYYGGTWGRFEYIRAFMERYESIKARFHLADNAPEWESIDFLKDLKTAALNSGRFFIKVLQTPDLTCAIAKASDLTQIVFVQRLDSFDKEAKDCFTAQINPEYVVVAQAGKSFNDRKDPASQNHYGDQIDVRGVWPDKIAASRALLNRQTGNSLFDEYEDNYVDIQELSQEVPAAIVGMLLNQVQTEMTFRDASGAEVVTAALSTEVFSAPSSMKTEAPTHWIETPISSSVAAQIGVPMQQTSFQEVLLGVVVDGMRKSQSHRNESQTFLNSLSVIRTSKAHQLNDKSGGKIKDFGALRLVALTENNLANSAIAMNEEVTLMGELQPEQLEVLIKEKKDKVKTSKLPAKFKNLTLEELEAYRAGDLPKSETLEYLLSLLPAAI